MWDAMKIKSIGQSLTPIWLDFCIGMVLLCKETPILHRGVTYQTEEKEVAETMKHYGVAKLLN